MNRGYLPVALVLFCATACSESQRLAEPAVSYSLNVTPAAASPGDTVRIVISVGLMAGVDTVRVRGHCAENVQILSGREVVASVPLSASCPDSTLILNSRGADPVGGSAYFYNWVIPDDLSSGTYTLRGRMLVAPDLEAEETLEVQ